MDQSQENTVTQQHLDLKPKRETNDYWQEVLTYLSNIYIEGNKFLQKSPANFISQALGTDECEDLMQNFVPLRKRQLQRLTQMSDTLGIPLSPIGMLTFTPGAIERLTLQVSGSLKIGRVSDGVFNKERMGGVAIKGNVFKQGPAKIVGLWLYQSADAQNAFELSELEYESKPKQGTPVSMRHSRLRDIGECITHEGFHSTHSVFELYSNNIQRYEEVLLRELLAFRTSLILGTMTNEQLRLKLMGYIPNITPFITSQINELVDLVSVSLDPTYQAHLTWRGVMASNVRDFISPPNDLITQADEMSDYCQKKVLGEYCQKLLK